MSAFRLLPVACLLAAFVVPPALADETPTLSKDAHQALSVVYEQLDQESWQAAISALDEVVSGHGDEPHALATALQLRGYAHVQRNDHAAAVRDYQAALETGQITGEEAANLRFTIAQLLFSQERYAQAASAFDAWMANRANIDPDVRVIIAAAYLQSNQYSKGAEQVRQAIAARSPAPEAWYQMLLSAYHSTENYPALARWLPRLIDLYPDNSSYWLQLVSVHMQTGDNDAALAVMDTAYRRGLLEGERDLLNFFHLMRQEGLPQRAATRLSDWLEAGRIHRDFDHYKLLAETWLQAKDFGRAEEVVQRLLNDNSLVGDKGQVRLMFVRILMDQQRAEDAVAVIDAGTADFSADDRARALFLKGVAAYEAGQKEVARESFSEARQHASVAEDARRWLSYMEAGG